MPSETIAADAPSASPRAAAAAALDRAVAALTNASAKEEAVRVARRSLKRVEAILALFEDGTAKEIAAEARRIRKALGALRDQQAMEGHLAGLKLPAETSAALALAIRRGGEGRTGSRSPDLIQVAEALRALRGRLDTFAEPREADRLAEGRLRALYAAARRKGERAFLSGRARDLHALRTAVGKFGDLARALWPTAIEDAAAMSVLKRALGEHHDLSVLWSFVRDRPELLKLEKDSIRRSLRQRRDRQQRRAERAFLSVFTPTTKAFARALAAPKRPAGAEP